VVVEGQGEFEINERLFKAEPFDVFVIDSGQTYLYKGEMKLIEFNVPATDRSNYKKVERGANS
jgi:gentisate 1,2-dioxygenase